MLARALIALAALPALASAADFLSTQDAATVLYDAPSARAKPLFVYGRGVPVEALVSVEGWTKVRDAAGTIGWMAGKSLSDKRMLVVRAPVADVRAAADEAAPVVFRAERDVLLEMAEPAAAAASATPGWIRVRHRDGQSGYVRLSQVFGF
jgi:SH3-like domain-containing protein